jgi:hypothetical protein
VERLRLAAVLVTAAPGVVIGNYLNSFQTNVSGGLISIPLAVGVGHLLGYRVGATLVRRIEVIESEMELRDGYLEGL